MIKIKPLFLIILGLFVYRLAYALPVSSSVKPVSADIDPQMHLDFELYADTHSDSIIWYVPKFAGLARDRSHFNQPNFSIHAVTDYDRHSEFYQEKINRMSGVFDLSGHSHLLQKFASMHPNYRFKLAPFTIDGAYIISESQALEQVSVRCHLGICETYDKQNQKIELYELITLKTQHNTTSTNPFYSFKATAQPYLTDELKDMMGYHLPKDDTEAGTIWEHLFKGVMQISVPTYSTNYQLKQTEQYNISLSLDCIQGGWNKPVEWVNNAFCRTSVTTESNIKTLSDNRSVFDQVRALDYLNKNEALARINWSRKCGHISAKAAQHAMFRFTRHGSKIPLRNPKYPVYLTVDQRKLWIAPQHANMPCSYGPNNKFKNLVYVLSH